MTDIRIMQGAAVIAVTPDPAAAARATQLALIIPGLANAASIDISQAALIIVATPYEIVNNLYPISCGQFIAASPAMTQGS